MTDKSDDQKRHPNTLNTAVQKQQQQQKQSKRPSYTNSFLYRNRVFNPVVYRYRGPPLTDDPFHIIDYNRETRFLNLAGFTGPQNRVPYKDTLVVYTAGSCDGVLGNKYAGIGVSFGLGSPMNIGKVVLDEESRRRQLPGVEGYPTRKLWNESMSAFKAVELALEAIWSFNRPFLQTISIIVLTTNSTYVTGVMCAAVWQWEKDYWKDDKGQPIDVRSDVERIHDYIKRLEAMNKQVQFWTLEKGNENALLLAENAIVEKEKEHIALQKKRNDWDWKRVVDVILSL